MKLSDTSAMRVLLYDVLILDGIHDSRIYKVYYVYGSIGNGCTTVCLHDYLSILCAWLCCALPVDLLSFLIPANDTSSLAWSEQIVIIDRPHHFNHHQLRRHGAWRRR